MVRRVSMAVASAISFAVMAVVVIASPSVALATSNSPTPIPLPTYYQTPTNTYSPIVVAPIPGTNKMMVALQGSDIVVPFDPATGAYGLPIYVHSNTFGIAVTPDAKYLLATGYDCSCVDMVAIDDYADATVINLPAGAGLYGITINPLGTKAYVFGQLSGYVYEIDLLSKTQSGTSTFMGGQPVSGTVDQTGTILLTNRIGTASLTPMQLDGLWIGPDISVGFGPVWSVLSRDGAFLYVTGNGVNSVTVLDSTFFNVVETIPVGTQPWGMAISPDGKTIAVDNRGANTMSLIDTVSNTVFQTIELPASSGPWSSAFTENGQYLVTMLPDNSLIAVSKMFDDPEPNPLPDTGAQFPPFASVFEGIGVLGIGAALIAFVRIRRNLMFRK